MCRMAPLRVHNSLRYSHEHPYKIDLNKRVFLGCVRKSKLMFLRAYRHTNFKLLLLGLALLLGMGLAVERGLASPYLNTTSIAPSIPDSKNTRDVGAPFVVLDTPTDTG